MTKDEFQKTVDDVIEDCIRNDYTFGSYAHRVTDAVWPLFEAAEKEATQQRILAKEALRAAERREKKCDALRAKIAEMEQQEPAGTVETLFDEHVIKYNNFDKNAPVYFAPCVQAQPAPSVPDGVAEALQRLIENGAVLGPSSSEDALLVARYRQRLLACAPSINEGVRKVTLDFRWDSEAQHPIPTIEIEFEPVSPNDAKGWRDRDRLAAMLTPEAKP